MLVGGGTPGGDGGSASLEPCGEALGDVGGRQRQHSAQQGFGIVASPAALPDEQRTRYLTLLLLREVQRYAAQVRRHVPF